MLYFDQFPVTQRLLLPGGIESAGRVMVQAAYPGERGAQMDAILLNGTKPSLVYGSREAKSLAKRKLSEVDHDLIDAGNQPITLVFDIPASAELWLEVTARIEPQHLSPEPFKFPLQNTYQEMTAQSAFYTYEWNSQIGRLHLNGELDDESLGVPFFKQFVHTGSGHPDGMVYAWVRNDARHLYVAIDFLPDNTEDNGKDYARVYVNTPAGIREFNLSVPEQRWGRPGFTYTSRAVYQHKVYEFALPLSELKLDQQPAGGEPIQLAFAAYGTATPNPNNYPAPYDLSFDGDGYQTIDIGSNYDTPLDVALQEDGKILIAGYTIPGSGDWDIAVARLNTDGSLDTTFNFDGILTTSIGGYDEANAIAVQQDGKIVVAGSSDDDFALVRYTEPGFLDLAFGLNGKVVTDLGGSESGNDMVIQRNGMIVVAGSSDGDFALARYTITGTLDTNFGTGGIVTTNLLGTDIAYGITEQEDGKLVVVGKTESNFAVVRYTRTGIPDVSFGINGAVATNMGSPLDIAYDVAIQENDLIVVAGGSAENFALARYSPVGVLDINFDGDGKLTTDFGSTDTARSVTVMPDGKIIAAGSSGYYAAAARYHSDGSLDNTFGSSGQANTYSAGFEFEGYGMAIQTDQKVILIGKSTYPNDFSIVRLAPPTMFLPVLMR